MKAFIAMPFHSDLDWVYDIISESCYKHSIEPRRVDKIAGVENIWQAILTEIDNCDIFIADFSPDPAFAECNLPAEAWKNTSNTNVATEAGYARARQKPIVLLTHDPNSLPLDWRVILAVLYPKDADDIDGVRIFRKKLDEQLKTLGKKKYSGRFKLTRPPLEIEGFRFLREETYSGNGIQHTIASYQHLQTGMDFALIPPGSFMMGSPESDDLAFDSEKPQHQVAIATFVMSKYPVTQKVWQQFMSSNPAEQLSQFNPIKIVDYSLYIGDKKPTINVSWYDCQQFCKKTGLKLPTEAQWEYACRAGTTTRFYWGNEMDGRYCWYSENSGGKTHTIGQNQPNLFGLFDMSGNIYEWCEDSWHNNYHNAPTDGRAWVTPSSALRVYRGGFFWDSARYCRSAARNRILSESRWEDMGFRVAASVNL